MQERVQERAAGVRGGLNKKVTPYEWGKDVAPGCSRWRPSATPPGHTSFILSSGNDKVFIQSDVTNLPALFVSAIRAGT